jgi:threonine dehydrogenase-like Zn-dependent dehydrogenase
MILMMSSGCDKNLLPEFPPGPGAKENAAMRAAVMRGGALVVDELADPVPGPGQALVRTRACGICGSDLHFLRHGAAVADMMAEGGFDRVDTDADVVMGHEFSAEVLEYGPGATGPAPGALVTSLPVVLEATGRIHGLGFSNVYPGGYAERMVLNAPLLLEVPNGLDAARAALTEPMAVGAHAVARSGIVPGEAAVVLGCGPVGLAVIAALGLAGIEPIVAADFSPARRRLAAALGAHEVVDPTDEPAVDAWRRVDGHRQLVIFEAVGVPGMIEAAIDAAPRQARLMVVGVCMEQDHFVPVKAVAKELTIQFALAYTAEEFTGSLRAIAEGAIDVAPLVTGTVGLDGVAGAFDALADPEEHCKVLITP